MAAPAYSPAAPPQQQQPMSPSGTVNTNDDVEDWKNRFNTVLARPADHARNSSPATAQAWHTSLFGCCSPFDLCLITYCLPCVTFGKTHHRIRKNGQMEGYEPINTSCLLFCVAGCFGLHWVPEAMQRADLRDRYNLRGNCATDLAKACCCVLCDLVQQEKESEHREPMLTGPAGLQQGYQAQGGMAYPSAGGAVPAAAPPPPPPPPAPPAPSAPVEDQVQEKEKVQETGVTTSA